EPPPAFDVSFTTRIQASVTTGSFNIAGTVQGRIVLRDGWRQQQRVLYEGTPRFEYTTISGPPCISGDGPIPTTWASISGPIGVSLAQQAGSAPGASAALQLHLAAPPSGNPPSERVTCAG